MCGAKCGLWIEMKRSKGKGEAGMEARGTKRDKGMAGRQGGMRTEEGRDGQTRGQCKKLWGARTQIGRVNCPPSKWHSQPACVRTNKKRDRYFAALAPCALTWPDTLASAWTLARTTRCNQIAYGPDMSCGSGYSTALLYREHLPTFPPFEFNLVWGLLHKLLGVRPLAQVPYPRAVSDVAVHALKLDAWKLDPSVTCVRNRRFNLCLF